MWFKQLQLFQIEYNKKLSLEEMKDQLAILAFSPCPPSMPHCAGWVSPIEDEETPLLRAINGYIMLCLQIEEKILPSSVIKHELAETIKQLQTSQDRKLSQKEKYALKDDIVMSLLPRAFSRYTKIYGYIDTKNNYLVVGSSTPSKVEKFISLFNKTFQADTLAFEYKKPSSIMTMWLKNKDYPTVFSVDNTAVMQDPNKETRIIRCRQQDLFSQPIQSLIKDGCEIIQLALIWNDCIKFTLSNDFTLSTIQYQDVLKEQLQEMELETKIQAFDADFLIMTESLSNLLDSLIEVFAVFNKKQEIAA